MIGWPFIIWTPGTHHKEFSKHFWSALQSASNNAKFCRNSFDSKRRQFLCSDFIVDKVQGLRRKRRHALYMCLFKAQGYLSAADLFLTFISVFWIFNVYKHWLTDIDVIKCMQIKESPYSWNILIISVPRGIAFLLEDLKKTLKLNSVHMTFLGQRAQSKFLSEEKFLLLAFC